MINLSGPLIYEAIGMFFLGSESPIIGSACALQIYDGHMKQPNIWLTELKLHAGTETVRLPSFSTEQVRLSCSHVLPTCSSRSSACMLTS